MSARITKAELAAQLASAQQRVSELEIELAAYQRAERPSRRQIPRTPERPLNERFAAARELAMRTGRCVTVVR